MPGSFYGLSIRDYSREIGSTQFNIGDLTAISLPGALADMGDLRVAIEAVILGNVANSRWGDDDFVSATAPTDPQAQRGVKWTIAWRDTVTGVPGQNFIPTADLSHLMTNSDEMDITAGVGLALKNAVDTLCKSPAGNAVSVYRIYYSD